MKITQLTLKNFRGAIDVQLQFSEKMTVFYGVNGAGKSTILEALKLLLSWVIARLKTTNGQGWAIPEVDIRNGAGSTSIMLNAQVSEDLTTSWSLVRHRKGRQNWDGSSQLAGATRISKKLTENNPAHYPVLALYPVTRAVLDIPLKIRKKHSFGPLDSYEESLSGAVNFRRFFEWFREREDLENEKRLYESFEYRDPQLEAVRRALTNFLPGFSKLTVKRKPLRMEVTKERETLRFEQLSDGEKGLLAMIGDLARRLSIANEEFASDPLSGDGIIMIDEIDLHLHPEWQRMVVPKLQSTFPNCQFFLTTHSPLVITNLKPANLYVLKKDEKGMIAEHPDESYGKNSTRVLEDLMGLPTTSPNEVAQNLRKIFQLIADNKVSEAIEIIQQMRNFGYDEPELKKAETLIRRREIIGK